MCYLGNKYKKCQLSDMGFSLDLRRVFCDRLHVDVLLDGHRFLGGAS